MAVATTEQCDYLLLGDQIDLVDLLTVGGSYDHWTQIDGLVSRSHQQSVCLCVRLSHRLWSLPPQTVRLRFPERPSPDLHREKLWSQTRFSAVCGAQRSR